MSNEITLAGNEPVQPRSGGRRYTVCFALGLACALGGLPATGADTAADARWEPSSVLATHAFFLDRSPALRAEAAASPADYPWRGAVPTRPDWPGVGRDISYFLGYQFVAIAVLYVAPESISGWDREQKRGYSFDKWRDNVSRPVWDDDRWWINYILHPYWGGAYYIQARERGLDRVQSFWYSALLSALYEYGAEALAEPVSAQDLVVTPVAGFLVGEYLFAPLRERIRSKPGSLVWSDKALLFITDPLGVISAKTDRLLGIKSTLQWQPVMQSPARVAGGFAAYPYPPGQTRGVAPAWGVQLRIDW
jgi:hypothetical protein